jgi:cytochrome c oxidase subunit 2
MVKCQPCSERLEILSNQPGTTAMVLAIALVFLVVGSVLFHYLSPWYFTPIASNWGTIDQTVTITFWVTGIVFVVVNLFMA